MERKVKANGNIKLPFAVFVCTKEEKKNIDYKNVITKIISDRLEGNFR